MNYDMMNYILSYSKLRQRAQVRSREMMISLGRDRIFFLENSNNIRVSLVGSRYQLSFAYVYGTIEGVIETALVGPDGNLIYIEGLDYSDVLLHEDTVETCLEEVERVERLLNHFANKIRNAWLNYKRRKDAVVVIQRAYREARDNPAYVLCEQIQMRHLNDIGCQLCN